MKKYLSLLLKLVAAAIMLQTLYFKFSAAPESVDLFSRLAGEQEALMRIGTGIIELLASILLFIPSKTWLGALLGAGTMTGAIFSHLSILGIEHNNDGGALFISALVSFISCSILIWLNRVDLPIIGKRFQ